MNIDAKALDLAAALIALKFDSDNPNKDVGIIKAALLAVRNEALEEAAKVAQELKVNLPSRDVQPVQIAHNLSCEAIATAIRALGTNDTTGGSKD